MDKTKALAWVKALRSGEYKQGKNALCKDNDGDELYCCLGVLAHINGFDKERLKSLAILDDAMKLECDIKSHAGDFYGKAFQKVNGEVVETRKEYQEGLASLNDSGISFSDIADLIENNYEYL